MMRLISHGPVPVFVLIWFMGLLILAPAGVSAHAADPHHELVQAGPYTVEVGFSEWPPAAERSLDITFLPEGGVADKTATLTLAGPERSYGPRPLGRNPRDRSYWGLDLFAFPVEGDWSMTIAIDGPLGHGEAVVGPFTVAPRPGPPPLPMYVIGLAPLLGLLGLLVVGWRRVRPLQAPATTQWI